MGHLSDPFIKTRLSGAPLRSLGSLPLCVSKHITVNGMENSFLSSFKPALAAPRSGWYREVRLSGKKLLRL